MERLGSRIRCHGPVGGPSRGWSAIEAGGPSGRPQAAEEIPVLVVRKEGLVEEADLLERPPSDEKGGARDRQETVRVLLPVERDNRGVIVVDDPGTDGRNAIIAF